MFRSMQSLTNTFLLLTVSATVCLTGCGDAGRGGVSVAGTITLDGSPMKAGSIVFRPADGNPGHKAGAELAEGRFSIDDANGPLPGRYHVEVYAPEESTVPLDDPLAYAKSAPRFPPPNRVAERFNVQTTLIAVVEQHAENAFSFAVESQKD